jgi:hypothetical protein
METHDTCRYLGNDAWDCGHIDNVNDCDCHVCASIMAVLRYKFAKGGKMPKKISTTDMAFKSHSYSNGMAGYAHGASKDAVLLDVDKLPVEYRENLPAGVRVTIEALTREELLAPDLEVAEEPQKNDIDAKTMAAAESMGYTFDRQGNLENTADSKLPHYLLHKGQKIGKYDTFKLAWAAIPKVDFEKSLDYAVVPCSLFDLSHGEGT